MGYMEFTNSVICTGVLVLICVVSIACRLFSVVEYESIIHEFDPWFNYRSTVYLVNNGWYSFLNWFDDRAWYPLGRVVGGTVFPGLMVTSSLIYHTLRKFLGMPIDIKDVCVFLAPMFSSLTALSTYGFTKEISGDVLSSLLSAFFVGIAPGYISRSVAGSYDNEGISIFLMITTFYFWIKSVKLGSPLFGMIASLFYTYMVSSWGGYVFLINLIPLHVFVLLCMGRFSEEIYVAYSTFYVLGTFGSMLIPFVRFNPTRTNDHMAAMGVFFLLQAIMVYTKVYALLSEKRTKRKFNVCFIGLSSLLSLFIVVVMYANNLISPWTERFYSLWDTGYIQKNVPIIASVSEHQPTSWTSFFFDLGVLLVPFIVGVYISIKKSTNESIFLVLYAICSSYFAGVMIRLMLVLTPIVCVGAGIGMGKLIEAYMFTIDSVKVKSEKGTQRKEVSNKVKLVVQLIVLLILSNFVKHCIWIAAYGYSSPSVILSSHDSNGRKRIIDDFREAYYWLRKNTDINSKVLSWWDYGYQISGFTERATIVDNNTWNNTHIATVGKVLVSSEENAYGILKKLDIDYILVLSGVYSGYSSDDINKLIWIVRISEGVYKNDITENDYYSNGVYRIDNAASPALKNSILYKLCYYRLREITRGSYLDRARGTEIKGLNINLSSLEEAFSTENYIVRIFRVKKGDPLGRSPFDVKEFEKSLET